ncbi:MAG: cobalt transporter CbiM [Deltaproteobacteria bacterium]
MHIPDGYLGPQTCGTLWAAMLPLWAIAARAVRKTLRSKQVPLLAVSAAFSFVVMMLNIPIPGGTTGHATGSVLAAILVGPWAACIALTVTLVVQALLFGDGGILAVGANCFNMGFLMVFAGYYTYRLASAGSSPQSKRRIIAGGLAGYVGLNVAAFATAVEFGLQPLLHHTPSGQPLYSPYGLNVAVPAMMLQHLLVFGWFEAVLTALVIKYLQRQNPELIDG